MINRADEPQFEFEPTESDLKWGYNWGKYRTAQLQDVSEQFGIPDRTLRDMISQGSVRAVRCRRRIYICLGSLVSYMQQTECSTAN